MDSKYWSEEYAKGNLGRETPSLFAGHCGQYIKKDKIIIELGCGGGADARYFANAYGAKVYACDQHIVQYDSINPCFISMDVTSEKEWLNRFMPSDIIYSRFFFHCIAYEESMKILNLSKECLNLGGLLMIEARSTRDDLYGKGCLVAEDTFCYNNHHRRFINFLDMYGDLQWLGFNILEAHESRGLAPYKEEDPVCVRFICENK